MKTETFNVTRASGPCGQCGVSSGRGLTHFKTSSTGLRPVSRLSFLIAMVLVISMVRADPALPYLDPSLPIDKRVDDLISRMTLEEKAQELESQNLRHQAAGDSGVGRMESVPARQSGPSREPPRCSPSPSQWPPLGIRSLCMRKLRRSPTKPGRCLIFMRWGRPRPAGWSIAGRVINISRNPRWGANPGMLRRRSLPDRSDGDCLCEGVAGG